MATDNELRELGERIARLSKRELLHVLSVASDAEERWRTEEHAEYLQQIETLKELERRRANTNPTGAQREAG